jgi:hypothetical protein
MMQGCVFEVDHDDDTIITIIIMTIAVGADMEGKNVSEHVPARADQGLKSRSSKSGALLPGFWMLISRTAFLPNLHSVQGVPR